MLLAPTVVPTDFKTRALPPSTTTGDPWTQSFRPTRGLDPFKARPSITDFPSLFPLSDLESEMESTVRESAVQGADLPTTTNYETNVSNMER